VPLGIVYATDAAVDSNVRVIDVFPASTHAPIIYPAAATRGAGPEAAALVAYLGGEAARAAWQKFGFVPLPTETNLTSRAREARRAYSRD